jgi:hypothetical protein
VKTEKQAYQAGAEAAIQGKSWKDNPHPTLSLQNIAWANGHISGILEDALEDIARDYRREVHVLVNTARAALERHKKTVSLNNKGDDNA